MSIDEKFGRFNPYYDPMECGLLIVGELECGSSYEFDTLVVWRRATTGKLFYATDAGCSCPTPFEGYDSLASLTAITPESFGSFEDAVNNHGDNRPNKDALLLRVRANMQPDSPDGNPPEAA